MNRTHTFIAAAVVAIGSAVSGVAFAQAPTPSAPSSSTSSRAAQIEAWTTKQWDAAKQEWAKDKTKWADCEKQSDKQKLEGRKSWSFLYTCMTT